MIHAGAVGLVLIIGVLSVVVGGVVVLFPVAAVRGGMGKGTLWGCLLCKSPVGQRKGFYIFHRAAISVGPIPPDSKRMLWSQFQVFDALPL